jgi:hypothetical protein
VRDCCEICVIPGGPSGPGRGFIDTLSTMDPLPSLRSLGMTL